MEALTPTLWWTASRAVSWVTCHHHQRLASVSVPDIQWSTFKHSCGCTAPDMPESREMTNQTASYAKQPWPSHAVCVLEDLKCWEAWDTTCWSKQSWGHYSTDCLEERGGESAWWSLMERMRKGHQQSSQHWNHFKGNAGGISEKGWSTHTGPAERLDTILNWSKLDKQGNKKRYIFWLMGTSDRSIVWARILLSTETTAGICIKTFSEHKQNHYHTLFYSISSISLVHFEVLQYACSLPRQTKPNPLAKEKKKVEPQRNKSTTRSHLGALSSLMVKFSPYITILWLWPYHASSQT